MGSKEAEIIPAKYGFTDEYTIKGKTATAYEFMYGKKPSHVLSYAIAALRHTLVTEGEGALKSIYHPQASDGHEAPPAPVDPASLTHLSLDSPEQFAMGWTQYQGIRVLAEPYLAGLVSSLTSADEATKQFWPTLARYSFVHNFIVLEKLRGPQVNAARSRFGAAWDAEGMESLSGEGRLYALDLTILDCVASPSDNAAGRYTHATYTILRQDPESKALEPVAIWVSGKCVDGQPRIYTRTKATPGSWLYALQAVKVSITVHAIWLRHAYLWHVVPGTMQMTMENSLPASHPIYRLLAPQSKYTIAFNELLLLFWGIVAPPTSVSKPIQFLQLANEFAKGRGFFDDDPKVVLERLGLRQEDFSRAEPWDQFVVVKDLLQLWDDTAQYVDACVDATYADDGAVAHDQGLQAWIAASSAVEQGNIRGLEPLESRRALKRLLTSILHRVIAHGSANMVDASILIHLFAPSYPMCLQRREIPDPADELDTAQLLTFLPHTETIGTVASFYFSFIFAKPYEPFVPKDGVEANLFFPGGMKDARNRALVTYRNSLIRFINARAVLPDQVYQWPLNIEI